MVSIEDFVDDTTGAFGIVDCPDAIVIQHLKDAAIQFFTKSHVWKQELYINAQANVKDYPIKLHDCVSLVCVDYVRLSFDCGTDVNWFDTCAWSTKYYPARTGEITRCMGHSFTVQNPTTVVINPPPTREGDLGLHLRASVTPKRDSCKIDELMAEEWKNYIVKGAASRVLMMNKQPWTNLTLAKVFMQEYVDGITLAKNKQLREYVSGALLIKRVRF